MLIRPTRWTRELEVAKPLSSQYSSLQREINRLIDSFFPEAESTEAANLGFSPSLDIVEGDKEFLVTAELPGLSEKDVELTFEKGVLRIKGEKKSEHEEKGKNFHRVERTYGSFFRSIPFATEIDESKIEARFDKGVLAITLPKAPAAIKEAKKISIKS